MKRRFAKSLFSLPLLVLITVFCLCMSVSAKSQFLIKQIIPDNAGKLILVTGTGDKSFGVKVIKLSSPSRLVIDFDDAILAGPKKSIKINNESIKDLRIAQFSSNPNQVRLVLTADSVETINKIKVSKNKNSILLGLSDIITPDLSSRPLYKDRGSDENSEDSLSTLHNSYTAPLTLDLNKINNTKSTSNLDKDTILKSLQDKIDHNIVLKNVKHFDNRVILSGTGFLSISEPMILENPKRLAFDIQDSVVNSDALIQPISLKNGDFIRIGQFDNKTVRIVVESKRAESYKTIISPDMQSIVIAPENEISFLEFPDSNSIGEIQDIKVFNQDKKTTKILLTSTKPIIHNLKHYNSGELAIDIYNLKLPNKDNILKLPRTAQFAGINFERIEKYPNGSRWIFPLDRTIKIESKLSLDGRRLEITLKDVMPVFVSSRTNSKRKIVIDAGHGGQEPGAIRAGIFEKDLTIDIAKRVKSYLQQSGYNVVMTRESDESVSLKQRTEITNLENADIFASIHINSSESPSARGLETYYYTPQSKELAQCVHSKIVNYIDSPDRGIRTARFYVIRNTQVPAILAEVGYISNDTERCSMLTEERKNTTAKAIAEGIINYLKSK